VVPFPFLSKTLRSVLRLRWEFFEIGKTCSSCVVGEEWGLLRGRVYGGVEITLLFLYHGMKVGDVSHD
jgi:hypothetical protein